MSILQIRKKDEPWTQSSNVACGSGHFERFYGHTKGFCNVCIRWKLFRIERIESKNQRVSVMGYALPFFEHFGTEYYGTCTNGHSQWFRPWERPEPKVWKRDVHHFGFDMSDRRDQIAKDAYLLFLDLYFRKPKIEEHYKHGHECSRDCPEYEYGWEDTWY